jgi:hypothetical protein
MYPLEHETRPVWPSRVRRAQLVCLVDPVELNHLDIYDDHTLQHSPTTGTSPTRPQRRRGSILAVHHCICEASAHKTHQQTHAQRISCPLSSTCEVMCISSLEDYGGGHGMLTSRLRLRLLPAGHGVSTLGPTERQQTAACLTSLHPSHSFPYHRTISRRCPPPAFRPKKVPEGTKQYQLRKYAEQTLVGSGKIDGKPIENH